MSAAVSGRPLLCRSRAAASGTARPRRCAPRSVCWRADLASSRAGARVVDRLPRVVAAIHVDDRVEELRLGVELLREAELLDAIGHLEDLHRVVVLAALVLEAPARRLAAEIPVRDGGVPGPLG